MLKILGVKIEDMGLTEVLQEGARSFKVGPALGLQVQPLITAKQLVTINPEFLVEAQHNQAFRECLNQADLRVVDGFGLVLAGLLYGRRLRRLTGVQLVERASEGASKKGWRVFLLGGRKGVAEKTCEVLKKRFPGLMVRYYPGSPNILEETEEEREDVLKRINDFKPHFLFVAYGFPAQDLWIYQNRSRLLVGMAAGVGGTFDYLSGQVARAPFWMRRLGLEWVYRFIRAPRRRFRRILKATVVFPLLVLRERLRGDMGDKG